MNLISHSRVFILLHFFIMGLISPRKSEEMKSNEYTVNHDNNRSNR